MTGESKAILTMLLIHSILVPDASHTYTHTHTHTISFSLPLSWCRVQALGGPCAGRYLHVPAPERHPHVLRRGFPAQGSVPRRRLPLQAVAAAGLQQRGQLPHRDLHPAHLSSPG